MGVVYNNVKVSEVITKVNRKKQSKEVEQTSELYLFFKKGNSNKRAFKKIFCIFE
ncbi:MAG: hypothetical protein ACLSXC_00480 [Beduini sp.]